MPTVSVGYGQEYGFEDLTAAINGVKVGILGAEFGMTKDHVNIIGAGNQVVALGRGKLEPKSGKITLLQSDFEALTATSGDPTGWAPFTVTLVFAPVGGAIKTYYLIANRVRDWGLSSKAGDTHSTIDLETVMADVRLNK